MNDDLVLQARQLLDKIRSEQHRATLLAEDKKTVLNLLAFLAHDAVSRGLGVNITADLLFSFFQYAYSLGYQDGEGEPKLDNAWFES